MEKYLSKLPEKNGKIEELLIRHMFGRKVTLLIQNVLFSQQICSACINSKTTMRSAKGIYVVRLNARSHSVLNRADHGYFLEGDIAFNFKNIIDLIKTMILKIIIKDIKIN
ncbi:hypothetical protein BpHYR1_040511 [Brachionus plicatilis]|uniref:Uncharacterized protein n=1 Tax=Brachionus plicatilis TaxID=10195 RepID=A0A3M7T179_BRAPC|nr:hypothetical protein BpHYR1_040511 [Brachionus plicatilis]